MLPTSLLRSPVSRATALLAALWGCAAFLAAQTPDSAPPSDCSAYESLPLPADAEATPAPKSFPACASYRSYRGIGRPRDYKAALACAWQERRAQNAQLPRNSKEPTSWFVGGSLILADMYANGAGVPRNIPLALRFACESSKGMAELAMPVLKRSTASSDRFELCKYADATFEMNFCEGYFTEVDDDRRDRFYKSLERSMPPQQQAAFRELLAAKKAYIEEHASEVDQGGTIRTIRTLGSQQILEDLFHTDLVHYERAHWPKFSSTQIATADSLVQREYNREFAELSHHTADEIAEGAVTPQNLARVQRPWANYREAWVRFAKLRYPTAVAAIRTKVDLDRYRLLKKIY